MTTPARLSALAAAVLLPALTAAPALASGGHPAVTRAGSCSDGATWRIKAKADDGKVEVEAETDSNVAGQRWVWTLRHEGTQAAKGATRTAGRSGSFRIERRTPDAAGADSFTFRATHAGQTCVARVTLPA